MTFQQILSILWWRRLYIVLTIVLALVVAAGFLHIQEPNYASTASIRYSSLATSAAKTGQLGSTQVDFSVQSITLPSVLAAATKLTGDKPGAIAGNTITYQLDSGNAAAGTSANGLVDVTAYGPSAASARARVKAVIAAYNSYLLTQQRKALAAASAQKLQATSNAETYQSQVTANPNNLIAESSLADALKSLGSVNTTINNITSAGQPVLTFSPADSGVRQGVGTLTALLIALVCGLVAGIAMALIRDQFDTRLRGESEIHSLTGVAGLGELRLDRRVSRRKQQPPLAGERSSALNEDMRGLRLTLQVLLPASHGLIVFTSVEPGDGKTFISANLAVVWARAGKNVILVGGDLRRPGLSDYYDEAAAGAGLTELLESSSASEPSSATVESYLQPTRFEGLRILPSGAQPSEPSDLLARPALDSIFDILREMSDIVIVDSPPSMALVDATQLAATANGVVVVASIGRTKRDNVITTVRALKSHGVVVLGVVANRSRRKNLKSYDHYYKSNSPIDTRVIADPGVISETGVQSVPTESKHIVEPAGVPATEPPLSASDRDPFPRRSRTRTTPAGRKPAITRTTSDGSTHDSSLLANDDDAVG